MRPELEQSYHSSKIIYITTTAMLLSSFSEQFIKKKYHSLLSEAVPVWEKLEMRRKDGE